MTSRWTGAVFCTFLVACGAGTKAAKPTPPREVEPVGEPAAQESPLRGVTTSDDKQALIIAVGDYPEESGWSDISSQNDVPLILAALDRQGFAENNITILRDGEATAEGIRAGFAKFVERLQPGNVAVVHYSGHGHQITDQNSPPEEIDGYDEVLVAHGAPLRPPAGYDGALHIRDDELGELLASVQEKVGAEGHVLMTIDACHSGSATRSALKARGTSEGPIGPPAKGASGSRGAEGGGMFEARGTNAAPLVVLSAARDDQLAMEVYADDGTVVGSLTYAFTAALARANGELTYAALFNDIERLVASQVEGQRPQLEGARNSLVLSGKTVPLPEYYTVDAVEGREVTLAAGNLVGLLPGSVVAFYPANTTTTNGAAVLGRGKITMSGPTWSVAELEADGDPQSLATSWAVVESLGFGDLRLGVGIHPDVKERASLETFVNEIGVLELRDKNADLVFFLDEGGQVVLNTPDDRVRVSGPFDPKGEFRKELRADVSGYARRKLLTDLTLSDPAVDVALEVVPMKHTMRGPKCVKSEPVDLARFLDPGGRVVLPFGQGYRLRLQNRSDADVYVTLLGISSNGEVVPLYPAPGESVESTLLSRDKKEFTFPTCFTASAPAGIDRFKVFATREPVNFGRVVASRGQSARGDKERSPLDALLADPFLATSDDPEDLADISTRGYETATVAPEAGSTTMATVEVVEQ